MAAVALTLRRRSRNSCRRDQGTVSSTCVQTNAPTSLPSRKDEDSRRRMIQHVIRDDLARVVQRVEEAIRVKAVLTAGIHQAAASSVVNSDAAHHATCRCVGEHHSADREHSRVRLASSTQCSMNDVLETWSVSRRKQSVSISLSRSLMAIDCAAIRSD